MPVFEPPPTWANPVLVEKDKLTGKDKGGFNPVWLKWFVDLAAGFSGQGGNGFGFNLPYKQMIFGNLAGAAVTTDKLLWDDLLLTLSLGHENEVGIVSGGIGAQASDGDPGKIEVGGAPIGAHGGPVRVVGGDAGSAGGNGGVIEIVAGQPNAAGAGGDITVTAGNSGSGGGPAGDVVIASGAGDAGGASGFVELRATPVAGGGGAAGYLYLNGMTRWVPFLVANLPTPASGIWRAVVTDAIGPTFLAIVVGGGAVTTPVFFDGTNWRCG